MQLDRFLNLLATSLGALGSIFVLKSFLALKARTIATLARTAWGYSLPTVDSLAAQQADSMVGAATIFVAFLLGFSSLAFVPPNRTFLGNVAGLTHVAILLGVATLVALAVARQKTKENGDGARLAILESEFDGIILSRSFNQESTNDLRAQARRLIGATLPEALTPNEVLKTMAQILGRSLPAGVPVIPGPPTDQ